MKKLTILLIPIFVAATLFAGPKISADKADVDLGAIMKKEMKDVNHTYILKNTGDAPLNIQRVKPSCGCTAVEYDSIINPGKTGSVKIFIKKSDIGDGVFSKTVRVYSNAENDSILKLGIGGRVLPPVEFSKRFLRVETVTGQSASVEVDVSTKHAGFTIKQVTFIDRDARDAGQEPKEIPIPFQLTNSKKVDEFGYSTYLLKLTTSINTTTLLNGVFMIKTNHPEEPSIEIRGMILPPEQSGFGK